MSGVRGSQALGAVMVMMLLVPPRLAVSLVLAMLVTPVVCCWCRGCGRH